MKREKHEKNGNKMKMVNVNLVNANGTTSRILVGVYK